MTLKTWKAGDHEVIEVVVRGEHQPYDRLTLREPTGSTSRSTVLMADQDPHGWRATAMRCLARCQEHHTKR